MSNIFYEKCPICLCEGKYPVKLVPIHLPESLAPVSHKKKPLGCECGCTIRDGIGYMCSKFKK